MSASLKLGDFGRNDKTLMIKKMYSEALRMMNEGDYLQAKELLEKVVQRDYSFVPAKTTLDICNKHLSIEKGLEIIDETKNKLD